MTTVTPKEQKVKRLTNRYFNLLIKCPPESQTQLIEHLRNVYGDFIKISRVHAEKGQNQIVSTDIKVAEVKLADKTLAGLSVTIHVQHRTSISYGVKPLQKKLCALLGLPKGMVAISEEKVPATKQDAPVTPMEQKAPEATAPAATQAAPAIAEPAPQPQPQPAITAPQPAVQPAEAAPQPMPAVPQIPQIDPVMSFVLQQEQMQPVEKKTRGRKKKELAAPEPLPPANPLNYVQSEVRRIEAANPPPAAQPAPQAKPQANTKPDEVKADELKPLPLQRQLTKVYGHVRAKSAAAPTTVEMPAKPAPKTYRGVGGRFVSANKEAPKV